ncbi:phosphatidylserine decarboxylase-domain-containing protein [Lipomyces oligophaga]|uniref:phosphatidylserine decarboxylase-domain-containing protein n=1 Tax=Lipomyces oligophaga TaxID=45792 RepID=UPI0034CD4461
MPPPPYVNPPPGSMRYMRRKPNFHARGAALRIPRAASGFLKYPFTKVSRRQMWAYSPMLLGKRRFFSSSSAAAATTSSSSSGSDGQQQQQRRRRFRFRLRWWHVPVAGGLSAVVVQCGERYYYGKRRPESDSDLLERKIRPVAPWQVFVYSALPLKTISRLWGQFNGIVLPVWMREPGYKFYAYVFGVNLDEVAEDDLTIYRNLGEFFYRELKPGARPIDQLATLVSPADGKILHSGIVSGRQVEQVKGMTYSLDALLGQSSNASSDSLPIDFSGQESASSEERDRAFASSNGIKYALDQLLDGSNKDSETIQEGEKAVPDASFASQAHVVQEIAQPSLPDHEMFFCVIYLAPGDYHRFHSPVNWVAETRRHFAGELYSVAPYFQHRLSGLFVLNERVALLGRWQHGFFSMTPVGATNVGSIKVHFDKDLKTNDPQHKHRNTETPVCYEATYANASKLLGGYPLEKGEQMGGFQLGSTVVLVFEAPRTFQFDVQAGQHVKVGEALGHIVKN